MPEVQRPHSELVEKIRLEFRPHQTVDAGYYDDRAYIQCTEHVPEGCYRCDLDAALDGLLEQLEAARNDNVNWRREAVAQQERYLQTKEQYQDLSAQSAHWWDVEGELRRTKEQYGTLRAAVDDLISHYRAEPDHEYRIRFWESFDRLRALESNPAKEPDA